MSTIQEQERQAKELSAKLWKTANDLRGTMEAYEFKSYILGLLFYKFLSDKTEKVMAEALASEGMTYEEAWNDPEYHDDVIGESLDKLGFVLEPKYLFSNVIKMIEKNEFSIDYLEEIINSITESTQGQESEEDFEDLFADMDLKSSKLGRAVAERSKAIAKVIQTIDTIELDYDSTDVDILGSAYVELISNFASTAGKKGGEFFTPTNMSKLVARLATVGLTDVKSCFDPACGSGSLLLQVGQYANVRQYFGQELTAATYNLARMNMMLHGIDFTNFRIVNCNTITNDEELGELKHQVQVANPPYAVKWDADPALLEDERFAQYGVLAPKSNEDLMFVEHMIAHMDDGDSRIACLLPHGILFRSGAEETIRKYMIEQLNVIDAIIGLPANCFQGASIPVCCMVLKKERNGNKDNICFIDASNEFVKGRKSNTISEEHINKIVETYIRREDVDRYCHISSLDEIRDNDFNLNIPRYVDTFIEEALVDIVSEKEALRVLEEKTTSDVESVKRFLKELGL